MMTQKIKNNDSLRANERERERGEKRVSGHHVVKVRCALLLLPLYTYSAAATTMALWRYLTMEK